MAFLQPVETVIKTKIVPGLTDLYFKNDPLLAFLKRNCLRPWEGPAIQENLVYGAENTAPYAVGESFNISQLQTFTGTTFYPKYNYANVTFFLEKIRVEMQGAGAAFDYVTAKMENGAASLAAQLAVQLYNNGQSAGRTNYMNGLEEALNDGTNAGWNGSAFTSYGTVARSAVGSAMNSPMTGPTANMAAGAMTYPVLEQAFNSVCIGSEFPDLIVTTNNGMSYIKMVFQPQQRFESTMGDFGFQGVKFNGSVILQSQYAPGAGGANDPILGNYLYSTGETLWFLNTKYLRLYVATDELFGFGWTGFKPAQDSNTVASQLLVSCNLTCPGPRYSRYLFNFAS